MMYDNRMTQWSASEARAALPEILDRVEGGEEAVITRHGKPVAVVVRPDRLRARRNELALEAAGALHDRLESARHAPRPSRGISRKRGEALVRDLRTERDRS